jgi:hypothetical protein
MINHRVIVHISNEFLNSLLFPDGTKIIKAFMDTSGICLRDNICMLVEHPDLPEIIDGVDIPRANPIYHKIYKGERDNEVDIVKFESWNIKHD